MCWSSVSSKPSIFLFLFVYGIRNITRAIQAQIQVCHTALTPIYLNLDICNLIAPAPEFNYWPFCHRAERRDHSGQMCCRTWLVRTKTSSCDSNWLSILSMQHGRLLSNRSEKNSTPRQISLFEFTSHDVTVKMSRSKDILEKCIVKFCSIINSYSHTAIVLTLLSQKRRKWDEQ